MSAPPTRWRLRRALELFFAGDGDAYLLRGGSGAEHVVRAPEPTDRQLLEELARGGVELPPGSRRAERALPLIRAGAIVAEPDLGALEAGDAERFDRQLPYLEEFGDPVALQRRLRGSVVAVIGCGGLGTWALAALACTGVGRFVLVDDDVVSLSNLNRQVLYGAQDVGRVKVERAAAWLAAFDERIALDAQPRRIRSPGDLEALATCDAWVLAADWPPYELARWVNEASLRAGVPFVVAGQQPPLVKVGPTFVPGRGACFACQEARLRADFPLYDELAAERRRRPVTAATLGPASALAGALLASEVLHLLVGTDGPATHDRMVVLDTRTLQTRSETIAAVPGCASCGG